MIHDRDAHADVLRVLREEGPPDRVVFHAFSGDAEMARECAESGFVLSFPGVVTFTNAPGLREALLAARDARIVVETDAPFLTPHPYRGRPNAPYLLPWTLRRVAAELAVEEAALADRIRETGRAVFTSNLCPG
jgi:TatD DNase family protein